MAKPHAVRRIALLLALSLLVAPWALAGPLGETGPGFFLQTWNLLTGLWSDEGLSTRTAGAAASSV